MLDGYKLVYQGGHHSVYCNGENHIWTDVGYTKINTVEHETRRGKCDCDYWKQWNEQLTVPKHA